MIRCSHPTARRCPHRHITSIDPRRGLDVTAPKLCLCCGATLLCNPWRWS